MVEDECWVEGVAVEVEVVVEDTKVARSSNEKQRDFWLPGDSLGG